MNRWRWTAAALAVGVAASSGVARAADLPQAVRTAPSIDASGQTAINTYVQSQLTRVAAHDKSSSASREELCRQAEANAIVAPSGAFISAYLKAVDTNIDVLLKDKSDKGVQNRLNAAIIIARLTISTKLTQLNDKTLVVVADDVAAVSLWGIKSAGAMLPNYLSLPAQRVNQGQKMVDAIVAAGKKHVTVGPLVQTAYDQLDLNDPKLPAEAYLMSVDAINGILDARLQQYLTAVPDFPQADRVPIVFFVKEAVLRATSGKAPKQTAVVQNLVNVLGVTIQRLEPLPPGEKGAQVVSLMTNSAGALDVWFRTANPAVSAKFKAVAAIRQPTIAKVSQPFADALAALQALPDYKAIKDAPKIK